MGQSVCEGCHHLAGSGFCRGLRSPDGRRRHLLVPKGEIIFRSAEAGDEGVQCSSYKIQWMVLTLVGCGSQDAHRDRDRDVDQAAQTAELRVVDLGCARFHESKLRLACRIVELDPGEDELDRDGSYEDGHQGREHGGATASEDGIDPVEIP